MAPIPEPGGGRGKIIVTPKDIASAAKAFYTAQNDLFNAWETLQTNLDGNAGMAGDDDPAKSFNSSYAPAVRAAWKALRSSAVTLGGISTGLTQTANNFVIADHHSAAKKNEPLSTFPQEPVFADIGMADVSSPIGPGETVWFLPGPLSRFWPNAHTDKVRAAATAWHNAAGSVETISLNAQSALIALEANDDTARAINDFWSQVYSPGNNQTVLAGTHQICQSLGDACNKYADAIDSKRSSVKGKVLGAGIAVGVTTVLGVLGTVFTGGGSDEAAGLADAAEVEAIVGDVAADTAATVESEVGATVGGDLVATVEAAADDAPAVETAEAETTQVQGDLEGSLDKAMADAEGEGESGLSPKALQEAYDYANTEPKLAHILDPAKHGFADLIQAAGGRSQAMELMVNSLGAGQDLPESGPFVVTRIIDGAEVTIRGAMVNGIPKIGTAFIADAFPGVGP